MNNLSACDTKINSLNRMTLREFCENYVGHNTLIHLYTACRIKDENSMIKNHYTEVWSGMDFQISFQFNKDDMTYFQNHPNITVCPYMFNNVIQVINNFEKSDDLLEISLIIE